MRYFLSFSMGCRWSSRSRDNGRDWGQSVNSLVGGITVEATIGTCVLPADDGVVDVGGNAGFGTGGQNVGAVVTRMAWVAARAKSEQDE